MNHNIIGVQEGGGRNRIDGSFTGTKTSSYKSNKLNPIQGRKGVIQTLVYKKTKASDIESKMPEF